MTVDACDNTTTQTCPHCHTDCAAEDQLRRTRARIADLLKERNDLKAEVERLQTERVLLAKLAADTPQFNNPLQVYEAQKLRKAEKP